MRGESSHSICEGLSPAYRCIMFTSRKAVHLQFQLVDTKKTKCVCEYKEKLPEFTKRL